MHGLSKSTLEGERLQAAAARFRIVRLSGARWPASVGPHVMDTLHTYRAIPLFASFLFLVCLVSLHAAEPRSQTLNSGWEFSALNASAHPEVAGWQPAQVPGVVQTDHLAAHLIPDPFYGDNEAR